MPDVEVTLEGREAAGRGLLKPSDGALVHIVPTPGTNLDVTLDYDSPDGLVVSVGGSFAVLHDRLTLTGDLSTDVFDGKTAITGTITYDIAKDVSANISGIVGSGSEMRAGLTIRF